MARLIDDVRRNGVSMPWFIAPDKQPEWRRHMDQVLAFLRTGEFPVIVADNVSTYYFEATGQEEWSLVEHFPNLAPPYGMFWVEHKFPKVIHSDEKGDTHVGMPDGRTGVLIFGANREDVKGEGIPEDMRWMLCCEIFIDYGVIGGHRIDGSPGTINLAIDAEGRLIGAPWMQSFAFRDANEMMRHHMAWLHPSLLTVSFMHCKNVTMADNHTPAKLAKKYREKHGRDPASYKTLIIEPLKQILRHEGGSDRHGLAKALHICRGHFKDYRQGKGLFGKHHMLVWHEAIVRGSRGEKAPAREIEVKL